MVRHKSHISIMSLGRQDSSKVSKKGYFNSNCIVISTHENLKVDILACFRDKFGFNEVFLDSGYP